MNVSRWFSLLAWALIWPTAAQEAPTPAAGETTIRLGPRLEPLATNLAPANPGGKSFVAAPAEEGRIAVGRSDGASDLALLRKLQVTNFRLTDPGQGASADAKGFIGAEVATVLPQAASRPGGFAPTINSPALSLSVNEGLERARIMVGRPHGLGIGDRVRLTCGSETLEREVIAVPTGLEFEIDGWTLAPQPVFVYGRYVQDKISVDSAQVMATAVSALQELARQTESLQGQVETLKTQNADLLRRLEALEPKPK